MPQLTSSKIAEIFRITPSKVKRHVREFLGHDTVAGQQKGYARRLSIDDAFEIYMCGMMVRDLKLTIPEVKEIYEGITPWLKKHGYIPIKSRKSVKDRPVKRWNLIIFQYNDGRFFCHAKGKVSREKTDEKIEGIDGYVLIEKSVIEPIIRQEHDSRLIGVSDSLEKKFPISMYIKWFLFHMEEAGFL